MKTSTQKSDSDAHRLISKVLKRLTEVIWKEDKNEGDPPEGPTLSDIQNFTQNVPEIDFIRVVGIDAHFWVTLNEEGFNASDPPAHVLNLRESLSDAISRDYARETQNLYIHFSDRTLSERNQQRRERWRAAMQALKQELKDMAEEESREIKAATLYTLTQNREENENASLWLEATANEAQAIAHFILQTQGEPTLERAVTLHEKWLQWKESETNLQHPLKNIVGAWIQETTSKQITLEYDQKHPIGILKSSLGSVRDVSFVELGETARLREFATPNSRQQVESTQLQLFHPAEKTSILPAIMPLQIAHPMGLKPKTKAGAVSHEIRIFFEALMALEPNQQQVDMVFRLGDLIHYLYPDGKFNRTNQLPYIINALEVLHFYATVPWRDDQGDLRRWRPVYVKSPLEINSKNETPVLMRVEMPPDAKQGIAVDKQIMRELGKSSAPQFNAYLTAAWIWDKYGTHRGKIIDPTRPVERRNSENALVDATGKPIVNPRGKELTNLYDTHAVKKLEREPNPDAIKRYPVLSDEDLIYACFPNTNDTQRKRLLKRAETHWTELEKTGIVRIERLTHGWRILPGASHIAKYRGVKETQKRG